MLRNSADLHALYNRAHRTVSNLNHLDLDDPKVQNALQAALDALEHLDQVGERARLVRDIAKAEADVAGLKRQLQFYDTGVIPIAEDEIDMGEPYTGAMPEDQG